MSGQPASTLFLPWLRRGISTRITRVDGGADPAGPPENDELIVSVSLNQGAVSGTATVAMLGPGDVSGVDPRAFTRIWPAPDTTDAEPNYLPLVELRDPDLPWRYTPARANAADRLTPWLCLVVVADDEIEEHTPPGAGPSGRPVLGSLTIRDSGCLPDLATAWAWAHVQVSGATTLQPAQTATLLEEEPHRLTARLLCPRRLAPDRGYVAAVVPTFEAGRLNGLGETVPPGHRHLASAWTAGQARVKLPVYHRWSFRTGPGGDLESLVSRLVSRPAPAEVGTVELDVTRPGAGLPPASRTPLIMSGALRSPTAGSTTWAAGDRARWTAALEPLLNAPADLARRTGEKALAPPIYGGAPAGRDRIDGGAPRWLRDLAIDPRARAAAGLGALVVQEQRQELLAGAWAQAQGAREIDEELRFTELSRRASARLFARHLASARTDQLLAVTAPLHAALATGGRTAAARLADSPIPDGTLGGAWRRLNRPLGTVRRRVRAASPSGAILQRMNAGTVTTGTGPTLPGQMATGPRIAATAADQVRPPAGPPSPGGRPPRPDDALGPALAAAEALLRTKRRRPAPRRRLVLPPFQAAVAAAADPVPAIGRALLHRLSRAEGTRPVGTDLDTPALAPVFRQPAASALSAVAPQWLLPAAAQIPDDTVCLLEPDQRFVEAFLTGFNHALLRELVWNGYPADPRCTPLRHFWPATPSDGGPDDVPDADIRPITEWPADAELGHNRPEGSPGAPGVVVLLRSALLHRYPDTQVYLARARLDPATAGQAPTIRGVGSPERRPAFSGRLGPDLAYFGFDITVADLVGRPDSATHPGWYVMLAQPPSDTRFGLDEAGPAPAPVTAWRDLSWGHLAADASALESMRHIDLNAPLPDTRRVVDPVSTVWHADHGLGATGATAATAAYALVRSPVRVGLHGSLLFAREAGTGPPP